MGRSASKNNTVKRIKAVHRRAKFVGFLYLLGTLLLTVLSCVTFFTAPNDAEGVVFSTGIINLSNNGFAISEFWTPLLNIADGVTVYCVAAAIYVVLLLTMLINLCRAFGKTGDLFKKYSKTERPANAAVELQRINKKKDAMCALGKIFSGSFTALIFFNVLIYAIVPKMTIELFAGVALGVGVLFHFLCGLWGAKVTGFRRQSNSCCCSNAFMPANLPIYDPRMLSGLNDADALRLLSKENLKQEKREVNIWLFIFRNLFQLVTMCGLIIAVTNVTSLHIDLPYILNDTALMNPADGYELDYVLLALQAVMFIGLFLVIRYATSTKEFNITTLDCNLAGFKVAAIITLLGGVAYMAMQMSGASEDWIPVALVVAVAFLGFVVDCIIRPKTDDGENKILFYSDELEDEEYMNAMRKA